jgi:hypothetical protein
MSGIIHCGKVIERNTCPTCIEAVSLAAELLVDTNDFIPIEARSKHYA